VALLSLWDSLLSSALEALDECGALFCATAPVRGLAWCKRSATGDAATTRDGWLLMSDSDPLDSQSLSSESAPDPYMALSSSSLVASGMYASARSAVRELRATLEGALMTERFTDTPASIVLISSRDFCSSLPMMDTGLLSG
jgi:hypothetical protein